MGGPGRRSRLAGRGRVWRSWRRRWGCRGRRRWSSPVGVSSWRECRRARSCPLGRCLRRRPLLSPHRRLRACGADVRCRRRSAPGFVPPTGIASVRRRFPDPSGRRNTPFRGLGSLFREWPFFMVFFALLVTGFCRGGDGFLTGPRDAAVAAHPPPVGAGVFEVEPVVAHLHRSSRCSARASASFWVAGPYFPRRARLKFRAASLIGSGGIGTYSTPKASLGRAPCGR